MQARGEPWLTEGLRYVTDGSCPFCAQPLDGVGLIQDYRSFFSREYHALRDEVTGLKGQVDVAVGDRSATSIEQAILQNTNSVESWRQYCDVATPVLPEAGRIGEIMGASKWDDQNGGFGGSPPQPMGACEENPPSACLLYSCG